MKKLTKLSALTFWGIVILIACQPPEIPNHGVIIQGIPDISVIKSDEIIGPLQISVIGRNGLDLLTLEINGEKVAHQNLKGEISYSFPFTYFPNHLEDGKVLQIKFSAWDLDGDFTEKSLMFKVIDREIKEIINSDISMDQKWTSGKTYLLDGQIRVKAGATLTIEKGVTIKFSSKTEDEIPSGLVILKGAKLIAEGTSKDPIIFTSIFNSIGPSGGVEKTLDEETVSWDAGLLGNGKLKLPEYFWGGITIMGNAKCSFENNSLESPLHGFPNSHQLGTYGGTDQSDNSGILRHVTIIGKGTKKEGNKGYDGLTLAGLGANTVLENIEIGGGNGNGISILGGNVDLKNIVVSGYQNSVKISEGWEGKLENFHLSSFTGAGFNISGPEGDYYEKNHLLHQGFIAGCTMERFIHFSENANTDLSLLYFEGAWAFSGINIYPKKHNPKISQLITGLDYSKLFPPEFHAAFVPISGQHEFPKGVDLSKLDFNLFKYYKSTIYCP